MRGRREGGKKERSRGRKEGRGAWRQGGRRRREVKEGLGCEIGWKEGRERGKEEGKDRGAGRGLRPGTHSLPYTRVSSNLHALPPSREPQYKREI